MLSNSTKAAGFGRQLKVALSLAPAGMLMAALVAQPASAGVSGYKVAMPQGAKAGQLTPFQPCTYKAGLASRGSDAAECATLVVAENPKKPRGRLIALPVVKLPALKPGALEPIFWLQGGPGGTNLSYEMDGRAIYENHDLYMLGYRGVDDPTPLQCPEFVKAVSAPRSLSKEGAPRLEESARQCAARITASGIDLSHYTMIDVIEDHEALRAAVHVKRANLISLSYGTRVAQYYTRLHPTSVRRSIQIGVNPPGHFRWFPETNNEILREYARQCAAAPSCASRTPDLFKTVVSQLARDDVSYKDVAVDMDKARIGAAFLMFNKPTALMVFDAAIAAEKGDNSGLARVAGIFGSLPSAVVWGDLLSKGGADAIGINDSFLEQRRSTPTSFGSPVDLMYGSAARAWPLQALPAGFDKVADDKTPTLLINGNLDTSTPVKYGQTELLPHLANGHLVVVRNEGHESWLNDQKPALDRLMSGFLKDGAVDASLFVETPVFQ